MKNKQVNITQNSDFLWIVLMVSSLLIQLVGRYYSSKFYLFESFDTLKFILTLIVPLFLQLLFFKGQSVGLRLPRFDRGSLLITTAILVLIPLVLTAMRWRSDIMDYYKVYRSEGSVFYSKLRFFSVFTFSTIIGWEFLHRGFLLFNLQSLLEKERIKVDLARKVSILIVMVFEVTYHFIKPDLEAVGMLVFSPLLSYLAIRSRSIFLPLFLHLYVEFAFFLILTLP